MIMTMTCTTCGCRSEIKEDTYKKRKERGIALVCKDCMSDKRRTYSREDNDFIWSQIRLELGL